MSRYLKIMSKSGLRSFPLILYLSLLLFAFPAGAEAEIAPIGINSSEPLKIRTTNVKDTKFSISWYTTDEATGQIRYGGTASTMQTAYDDGGKAVKSKTHHITIRNLKPNTTYYYKIVSGGRAYQDDGIPFTIKTGPSIIASGSDVAYGRIYNTRGTPYTQGAIVYLTLNDKDGGRSEGASSPTSVLVDNNGYWSYELKNSREKDLNTLFSYSEVGDTLKIEVQTQIERSFLLEVDTQHDSPARDIIIREIGRLKYERF